MQEVKYLYQNFKLDVDRDGVSITNDSLFEDTSGYELEYVLYLEGVEKFRGTQEVVVEPLSEGRAEFDWPADLASEAGEYAIHAAFKKKEATLWSEAGYEVAFGQHVFEVETSEETPVAVGGPLRVVEGDVNIGVHGNDFSIVFSKQAGSLVSVNYSGREMIAYPPAPLFWRATTDNDKGYAQGFTSGMWLAASLARRCTGVLLEEEQGHVSVKFTYKFSISSEVEVKTRYTVQGDGSISVKSTYHGAENLPQLPLFGLSFKVPADYDQLEWYAMGPEENYSDRAKGAKLGIFKNTVAENLSPYVMPQESGNRTGVRRVSVTNVMGNGIKLSSVGEPLECNFSPYTAFELENAQHHYELPNVHYTVVTVAGKQMGVGGDDSWGAPVHDEHLLNPGKDMEFEFKIERI
jgi:beta-galactosidase